MIEKNSMKIGIRGFWTGTLLIASLCAANAATVTHVGAAIPDGFWAATGNEDADTYPTYLKIKANKGFYCIMDEKSSFAFQVIGDSITTPMNGMDRIDFSYGSGDVVIKGEEKGEPYSTRFNPITEEDFPEGCAEREEATSGTGIAQRRNRDPHGPHAQKGSQVRDMLGRHLGLRAHR